MSDLSNLSIDPNVAESGGFTVLPDGIYKAVIAKDKLTTTKDGKGRLLEFTVQIIEGPHAGSTITDRLNILNASQVAQNIAQGTLKRICTSLSVPFPPKNTDALLGKPMLVTVGTEEFISNKTGKVLLSNKIKNYAPNLTTAPAAPAVKSW